MKLLVFLEHHGGGLTKGSLGVLAKAVALGGDDVAAVLVGGEDVATLASEAGKFGAGSVYLAADAALAPPLPQPRVDAIEQVVRAQDFDTVLFANSVLAADVAAGLAARLEAGLNWDLVDLGESDGQLVGKRLALQDSLLVDVAWRSPVRLALFRTGSFEAEATGGDAHVETLAVELQDHSRGATIVSQEPAESEGPSIEDAEVIVAGGIGLGAAENFALAENLAEILGGAVGATRAVVYKGWYPHSSQVGQTGKTVTPKLYIALGISGAVQHKVGMQNSKVIVAINKDPNAPIFEFSDLAVVGDVHTIVPELIELLRRAQELAVTRPADFPPPFAATEFVAEPSDPVDERIEVGVLIVGAGPAGLACAIRFGQLLEENPDVAEQLGDVPLALLEKGKQPGSHLLSGAIVNPRSLRALLGDDALADMPSYGRVPKESVYLLTGTRALPLPPPPTMRNHGNVIVSLSDLGRWLAGRAEDGGAMILPETVAQALLVDDGRVVGVRTGDKGRGSAGEPLGNFEPGSDIVARVTVLAEGTQGHLTGVALDQFDLRGPEPQVWELGIKEVWKVPQPLDRIIHTMGWPLRPQAKYREFGGSFIYPMGDDMLSIGMVVGLDYRDPTLSPHDLLQRLKTHPKIRPLLEGGERLEWGAKTIPGGGHYALPKRLFAPGLLLCGDGAGMVNIPTLKGVHYAIEAGRLAAETAFAAVARADESSTALAAYDDAVRTGFIGKDLYEVRDMRAAFGRGFVIGAACAGAMSLSKGRINVGRMRNEPDDAHALLATERAATHPVHDGTITFDRLSSVFAAGNKTRDDQPNHIRIQPRVPADVATLWSHLCPAQVYTVGATGDDGLVTVDIEPSNCVQCGAISAKGGRLTPPEGGSGPEYFRV